MMEISIQLEAEDWRQFQKYLEKELPKTVKPRTGSFGFNVILWTVITFMFFVIFQNTDEFHWPTAGFVVVIFIVVFALFVYNLVQQGKAYAPAEDGAFVGEHHFVFDEKGIATKGKGYEARHNWSTVKRIERVNGMILIFLDTAYAFVLQESKLEDPDSLYAYISKQYQLQQ
ncbi:MAG: YcxB family protein [Gammaproteobacteria bacterium]|nr:YcxB family protein [Gammaproteobacteria bacterium]